MALKPPDFSLAGKIALVTGASRGLGWAIAQALAGAGAELLLNGRHPATLEARAAALRADGAKAGILPFDVADGAAVSAAIGALDRLRNPVTNARIILRQPPLGTNERQWPT